MPRSNGAWRNSVIPRSSVVHFAAVIDITWIVLVLASSVPKMVTFFPATVLRSVMHDRVALPSTSTVHAPQEPIPHPKQALQPMLKRGRQAQLCLDVDRLIVVIGIENDRLI